MRLAKFLAHAGAASRRGAEQLIAAGRVTVDGAQALDPARDVDERCDVRLDGERLGGPERRVVYAVNKPRGVVSTARDTHGRRTVVELVPGSEARLYPVGRLDADTTGLLLLTNDGELANTLTHPRYGVPKTYRARVSGGRVGARELDALRRGVALEDGMTAPARARLIGRDVIELELREGRKRQVRRMCEAIGRPVVELERVAFGPLRLEGLAPGRHRRLRPDEIDRLRAAARR